MPLPGGAAPAGGLSFTAELLFPPAGVGVGVGEGVGAGVGAGACAVLAVGPPVLWILLFPPGGAAFAPCGRGPTRGILGVGKPGMPVPGAPVPGPPGGKAPGG